MQRKKNILVYLAIFVILIIAILILNLVPNNPTKIQKYFSCNNPQKVTITSNNKSFSVSYDNNSWEVSEFNKIPINESFCEILFNSVKNLESENIFIPTNNLNDYGLEIPKTVVKIDLDSSSKTLKIGNMNPDKTAYYCLSDSRDEIALIPISQIKPLLRDHFQYANLNLIPYSAKKFDEDGKWVDGGITKCKIEKNNMKKPIEIVTDENGKLNKISNSNLTIEEDLRIQLENAPFALAATSIYAINPSVETIKSCGLNSPQTTVTYVINKKTYNFKIGLVSDSKQYSHLEDEKVFIEENGKTIYKSYYVIINDIPAIYSVSESNLPWLKMSFNY